MNTHKTVNRPFHPFERSPWTASQDEHSQGPPRPWRFNPFAAGAFLGWMESTALYWTVTWGNHLLLNRPVPRSLAKLYSGYSLNVMFMSPLFAVLVGVDAYVKKAFRTRSAETAALSATMAGVASAALNPLESALVYKTRNQMTCVYQAFFRLYRDAGFKGFFPGSGFVAMRNTVYSLGLNALTPWMAGKIASRLGTSQDPSTHAKALAISAFVCGGLAGIVSHPFHVLNVERKKDCMRALYKSDAEAWRKYACNPFRPPMENFRKVYTACLPRVIRCAVGSLLVTLVAGEFFRTPKERESKKP
jgi:hypothetical protein